MLGNQIKKVIETIMENKNMLIGIVILMAVMILAMSFIGYNLYQISISAEQIRSEIESLTYNLIDTNITTDNLVEAVESIYMAIKFW